MQLRPRKNQLPLRYANRFSIEFEREIASIVWPELFLEYAHIAYGQQQATLALRIGNKKVGKRSARKVIKTRKIIEKYIGEALLSSNEYIRGFAQVLVEAINDRGVVR